MISHCGLSCTPYLSVCSSWKDRLLLRRRCRGSVLRTRSLPSVECVCVASNKDDRVGFTRPDRFVHRYNYCLYWHPHPRVVRDKHKSHTKESTPIVLLRGYHLDFVQVVRSFKGTNSVEADTATTWSRKRKKSPIGC